MAGSKGVCRRAERALRAFALSYPEAHEDFPWGERVIKVRKKVFVFMGTGKDGLSLSAKLPASRVAAMVLPFAEPTHYGLGKSGWVTARFTADQDPPLDLLRGWIDESYRAIAPRTLIALLPGAGGAAPARRAPSRRAPKKSPARRGTSATARRRAAAR